MDEAASQPILAIDLGGTQIRAAYVSPDLALACRRAGRTDDREGLEAVVERICSIAGRVRDDAREAGLPDPVGVGISSPGPLDPWRGVVTAPPNLAGWVDVPLVERVGDYIGLPGAGRALSRWADRHCPRLLRSAGKSDAHAPGSLS